MSDAVSDHLDRKPLGVADCLVAGLPVTHHSGQLQRFSDPAAIVLPIQLNGQLHCPIIALR